MKNLIQLGLVIARWSRGIPHARTMIVLAIVCSALAGVGYSMLIALIKDLVSTGAQPNLIWWFFGLCIVIPLWGFCSQILLLHLTSTSSYHLRIQLARQLLAAPFQQLEKLGPHRLLATLTQDIGNVVELVTVLPQMLTQLAMIAGCFAYLGWLSGKLLLIMLVYMLVGLLSHQLPLLKSFRYFKLLREQWDAMYKAFHGLILGSKELKLNQLRREAFLTQQLEPAAAGIRTFGNKGNSIAMAVSNWGQILFFIFIGLLIFVSPQFLNVGNEVLIGYTLTVLFMITPLTMILNQIPSLERAYLSAKRIEDLGLSLNAMTVEGAVPTANRDTSWQTLDLIDVTHSYRQDGANVDFELGPINLSFQPGELVFLIGGNGSGKTTLVKLLMGLYEPEAGEIRLDGKAVTNENRDNYRQRFSVVFYDFYLFEKLFGLEAKDLDAESQKYLDLLQLSHKLQIRNGTLSTVDLSQGQRKRLALLNAYLENRPIYIFDEWAADQDPQFKEIFYYQLLPELKDLGKTIIVISHDDRYYELADRLIKLESGKVEHDQQLTREETETTAAFARLM